MAIFSCNFNQFKNKNQLNKSNVNQGQKFYARYDRRHDISLVGIYKPSERITLSATWVYGTGNAITLPTASYSMQGNNTVSPNYYTQFTNRNSFRMAAYHRMDIALQTHKTLKHGVRTWEFSFYNAYNRKNPFFYYQNKGKLKQITLFPVIPSISWTRTF